MASALTILFIIALGYIVINRDTKTSTKQETQQAVKATDLPGWWYSEYFGASVCRTDECTSDFDYDGDQLSNAQEFYYSSDPTKVDTNSNGKKDGEDVSAGIDPSREGNMTFDEVASDDNIFGESLLFSNDLKAEFTTSINPNNIKLPEIKDEQLKIVPTGNKAAIESYFSSVTDISSKYFTKNDAAYIETAVKSQDLERLNDLKIRANAAERDLMLVSAPKEVLVFHKYLITYMQLLPKVVFIPDQSLLTNETDPVSNQWYDDTQAFLVLMDKMTQELSRLQTAR